MENVSNDCSTATAMAIGKPVLLLGVLLVLLLGNELGSFLLLIDAEKQKLLLDLAESCCIGYSRGNHSLFVLLDTNTGTTANI